jgi:hypothetical protein
MDTLLLSGKVDPAGDLGRILMYNLLIKYGAPGVLIPIPKDR